MSAQKFILSGVYPIRGATPGFATPIFMGEDGIQYIQVIDRELVSGFRRIVLDGAFVIRKIVPVSVCVGDRPLFVVVLRGGRIFVGTKERFVENKNDLFVLLSGYPFVYRQFARFVDDGIQEDIARDEIEALYKSDAEKAEGLYQVDPDIALNGSFLIDEGLYFWFPIDGVWSILNNIEEMYPIRPGQGDVDLKEWADMAVTGNGFLENYKHQISIQSVWTALAHSYYTSFISSEFSNRGEMPFIRLSRDVNDTFVEIVDHLRWFDLRDEFAAYMIVRVDVSGPVILCKEHEVERAIREKIFSTHMLNAKKEYSAVGFSIADSLNQVRDVFILERISSNAIEGASIVEVKIDNVGKVQYRLAEVFA